MGRNQPQGTATSCAELPVSQAVRAAARQALPVLTAILLWVALFAAFAALGGCCRAQPAGPGGDSRPRAAHGRQRELARLDGPRSSLIFPAEPGLTPIPADAISRADWPTTEGRTSYGQSVDYQEYRYDTQGLGPYDYDFGYRTFTYRRTGTQVGP